MKQLFVSAVRSRVDRYGVPDHVYEAIVAELVGENGDSRTVNCPNGVCSVPLNLNRIWNYGCWCNLGNW